MSACGASWRKPVSQITDRQKRHRANHPDCKPKGKRCACGSRRNLVVGHRDGDESNGAPSNLIVQCKSCNTRDGKRMAKAGKGVRTRQYNPAAKPLEQMTLAEIKKEIPTASPKRLAEIKQFARWRGKHKAWFAKNPGAVNLAQYVQAAVEHSRGVHDEGGRIIHETPKAKRREFAREIAFRKGYGRNPRKRRNPESPADELYRKFHGRGPDKIITMLVRGVDPYGDHPELTSLGPLIRLVVGAGVQLNDAGEVTGADWVNEINFVPSIAEYRRMTERMDPKSADDVRKFKAWLKSVGTPDVAAVPNTRQLYFVGGKQELDDKALKALGCDPEKDLCDLGDCFLIEYFAQKRFDRFEPMTYYHALGEVTHVQPRLIYRRVQKMLELVGGEYVVKAAGIDN
jgi:hypothetical protein